MSYQGKYSHGRRRRSGSKAVTLLLALVLLTGAVSGTLAWLSTHTEGITNTFTAANVPNVPVEKFDGTTKESITVQVTGNIPAYVRVKLVTYRVAEDGVTHIGGTATVPEFSPANGWFKVGDYYYYPEAVQPNTASANLLPDGGIKLQKYTDADGGKQVIEVISESIQSVPAKAVEDAWPEIAVDGDKLVGRYR